MNIDSQSPKPALWVERLERLYANDEGIHGLDFIVPKGRVVALLGPNGSGKTTTIRCIAGMLRPDHGSVRAEGYPAGSPGARRASALVPDVPELYPVLTVAEHLTFRARAFRVQLKDAELDQIMSDLNIEHLADRLGGQLSRGQKQRVMLAAAQVQQASVLLLDEPTVGLDPQGQQWLAAFLRRRAHAGAGVLVASHDLTFVQDVADGLVMLRSGYQIAWEDVPRESARSDVWRKDVTVRLGAAEE